MSCRDISAPMLRNINLRYYLPSLLSLYCTSTLISRSDLLIPSCPLPCFVPFHDRLLLLASLLLSSISSPFFRLRTLLSSSSLFFFSLPRCSLLGGTPPHERPPQLRSNRSLGVRSTGGLHISAILSSSSSSSSSVGGVLDCPSSSVRRIVGSAFNPRPCSGVI